jgi:hypothetical protein
MFGLFSGKPYARPTANFIGYQGHVDNATSAATYLETCSFGPTYSDRVVVVVIQCQPFGGGFNYNLTSVTIGGVSATIAQRLNYYGDNYFAIAYASVPTNADETVAVNYAGKKKGVSIDVLTFTNVTSVSSGFSDYDSNASTSCDFLSGGITPSSDSIVLYAIEADAGVGVTPVSPPDNTSFVVDERTSEVDRVTGAWMLRMHIPHDMAAFTSFHAHLDSSSADKWLVGVSIT